jgi:hypothetical protein
MMSAGVYAVLFFQLATMLLTSVFIAVLFLNRSVLLRRGLARIIFWQAIADFSFCIIYTTSVQRSFGPGCVTITWAFTSTMFSNAWLLVLVAHLYLQASSCWVQAENADIYYHGFAWLSALLAFLLYFHEQVLLVTASFSPANYFVTGMGF